MTMMTVIYGCFLEGGHTLAVETGGRNEVSKDNDVLGGHTLKIPQVTEEEAIGKSGCFRLNTPPPGDGPCSTPGQKDGKRRLERVSSSRVQPGSLCRKSGLRL